MNGTVASTSVDYGAEEAAMRAYRRGGAERATALGNRGPIRFNADGSLHDDILEAYWRCGFYVFEDVLGADELADIKADFQDIWSRLPVARGEKLDARGRPALGSDNDVNCFFWAKPLGDPWGGTDIGSGRHQIEMTEPEAAAAAPGEVVFLLFGSLQFSDACLRVYGHPQLLRVAEQINGPDFTPFNESLFIKPPGLGPSVAWHQDGQTHWESPEWDEGTHGFNFMAQIYGSTAANGLWFVPGTHKLGKLNIHTLVQEGEADRIPGAVPLIANPGDVAISNRQLVHASFANTSPDWRVTVNFGFHRRSSVLNVETRDFRNVKTTYDDALIRRRSRLIGWAINARRQRFPNETPYVYQPFAAAGEEFRWDEKARAAIKDYNAVDLFI